MRSAPALALLLAVATAGCLDLDLNFDLEKAATPQAAVRVVPGADAAASDFVQNLTIHADGGGFDLAVRGIPEATVTLTDLLRLENIATEPADLTLATPGVDGLPVTSLRLEFFSGDRGLGVIDLTHEGAALRLRGLDPGESLRMQLSVTLPPGAGAGGAVGETSLSLRVS